LLTLMYIPVGRVKVLRFARLNVICSLCQNFLLCPGRVIWLKKCCVFSWVWFVLVELLMLLYFGIPVDL
jgi:hypothetical protein